MTRIRTILVPTDFGKPAKAALRYAEDLAAAFKSRLHILHVVSTPFVSDAWGSEAFALRVADIVAQSERAARKALAGLTPKTGPLAGRVSVSTTRGAAVKAILDCAATTHADLIVMGTHGRGTTGRWLLGSVAERVVRHARVPVLTVHGQRR